jgi:hypothetical protein
MSEPNGQRARTSRGLRNYVAALSVAVVAGLWLIYLGLSAGMYAGLVILLPGLFIALVAAAGLVVELVAWRRRERRPADDA